MRIQAIQHVPFETPGHIITICERAGHQMNIARVYLDEPVPDPSFYDLLLIMGGPMSIHDEDQYPWLVQEKQRVRETIGRDKPVIGFCLGAQIIADVLGAQVFKAAYPEIGWFPVIKTAPASMLGFLPDIITVFHWHGETFHLPEGATRIYSSDATPNQSFIFGRNVLALQFHPEITSDGVQSLTRHCNDELTGGPYIMKEGDILHGHSLYHAGGYKMTESIIRYFLPA